MKSRICVVVLALFALSVLAAPATAQGDPPTGHTLAEPALNVRTGPGEGYRVIAALTYDAAVVLEGRDDDGHWIRIREPETNVTGWITAFFLDIDENANLMDLPILEDNDFAVMPDPTAVSGPLAPAIPTVSEHAREIFLRGQELGNDPHAFTIVGDCNSYPHYFLNPADYVLGKYAYLQEVIDHFEGSFGQTSQASWQGFSPASVFDPTWANLHVCEDGETPLECEFRLKRPSVVFISLGTVGYELSTFPDDYEAIVQYAIEQGVIPILATKADNVEGNGWVNLFIAQIAEEYDVPLWNYWRAARALPNMGLTEDNWHLTWATHDFTASETLQAGWPVRNLTALQVLDAVWRGAMYPEE